MFFHWLDDTPTFPDPEPFWYVHYDGPVAMGGDLACDRLLAAYAAGIFPWYGPEDPYLWWCPHPRGILLPHNFHLSRSLLRKLHSEKYVITLDRAFTEVIETCAYIPRTGENGTWILPEMIAAYTELHTLGYARSVEVWSVSDASRGDRCFASVQPQLDHPQLVGGCYGVDMGSVFCAESMFSRMRDGSKIALAALAYLALAHEIKVVDCQFLTPHLASLGAREIRRNHYLAILKANNAGAVRRDWRAWQALFNDTAWPDKLKHMLDENA